MLSFYRKSTGRILGFDLFFISNLFGGETSWQDILGSKELEIFTIFEGLVECTCVHGQRQPGQPSGGPERWEPQC
jgi:hypothetical protein